MGDVRASKRGDDWRDEQAVGFDSVQDTFPPEGKKSVVVDLHIGRGDRRSERDDFLARVQRVCELREPGAKIERMPSDLPEYLRVSVKRDNLATVYPVGVSECGIDKDSLERFLEVHKRYRQTDPTVTSWLVYGGEAASDDLIRRAGQQWIRLTSFVEYQGLMDFRGYVSKQTQRLQDDRDYPPFLYVPQRLKFVLNQREQVSEDALDTVHGWLGEPYGRFILVLGEFGTGKTFLLHELARRMGEDKDSIVLILVSMRTLEKWHDLDALIAAHLAQHGVERIYPSAIRYMLEQGRIALMFDGFDELALRVTYSRATEHFRTLMEAAIGEAKIVVTSRTQHFVSDEQANTVLGEQVDRLPSRRMAHLERFDPDRIKRFMLQAFPD